MRQEFDSSHRRLNLLTGDYVLVSPHRTQRPWQGAEEELPDSDRPRYDKGCYLCPGNRRAGDEQNPDYRGTFVFDNDFAALQPQSDAPPATASELLVAEAATGRCRVICFSPRHDLTLADMDEAELRGVVATWRQEYLALGSDPSINHVQIFENKGAAMGCSNPHPHGQIWAQSAVPNEPSRELANCRSYFASQGRPLLIDYAELEVEREERLIASNERFVAVVPFWAIWPFEALVLPRRQVQSLADFEPEDDVAFAAILKTLTSAYDRLFNVSFPYSSGIHQAPTDGQSHPYCTLHMHFYPPLLRSATVKKFMVGYEMMGEAQRDLTPEASAARLRECVR